jgi:hypothetical protein
MRLLQVLLYQVQLTVEYIYIYINRIFNFLISKINVSIKL